MKTRSIENEYFTEELYHFVRSSFSLLERDAFGKKRIFFENSGGSIRLKSVLEEEKRISALPDCPERKHEAAALLRNVTSKGIEDIRFFLNAKKGVIFPVHTASKAMFEMIQVIAENTRGSNIVTTALEHPSSFDACKMYASRTGKELRVAKANPITGSVEVKSITKLIDKNTALLSIILTSNITGAIHDIKRIVKEARRINSGIFIVADGVQTAPHGVIDIDDWEIDGLNIAPYKMFGSRGISYAYISDRVARMPHPRVMATKEDNWIVGSPAPAMFAGFSKIVDYICDIGSFFIDSNDRRSLIVEGMTRIHNQEKLLLKRMIYGTSNIQGLNNIKGVKVHFAEENIENQDFIVSLTFDNIKCAEAVEMYGKENVLVYERLNTSFYSKRILDAVNLSGVVRVSPLHCHRPEEIDEFLLITKKIASSSI